MTGARKPPENRTMECCRRMGDNEMSLTETSCDNERWFGRQNYVRWRADTRNDVILLQDSDFHELSPVYV
jgi:hypothetical protein